MDDLFYPEFDKDNYINNVKIKYIDEDKIENDEEKTCSTPVSSEPFTPQKYLFVKSMTSNNKVYKVNLDKCSCTCPHWKYNGPLICKHISAAADSSGVSISELEAKLAKYPKEEKKSIVQVKSMSYPYSKSYDVDIKNKTCTCPSYTYSKMSGFMCKHIKQVLSK